MAPQISVLLAFRQPVLTIGVRHVLTPHQDMEIVAECATFSGALRALKKHRPRVAVAGSAICEGESAMLQRLAEASPETRVALFCTRSGDLPQHALLQGASAVLPPESAPEQVVECVRTLASGRRWRAPARLRANSVGSSRSAVSQPSATVLAKLSVRERQIAHAVATGKRNREIAEAFGISPGTVKLHLNRIYAKIGVNSRLDLFRKLVSEANYPL